MTQGGPARIILLDTDAASRLQVNQLRADYLQILETYEIFAITWVTEAEWRTGLLLKENVKRRERFEGWMARVVKLSVDDEVTRRYAELAAIARRKNQGTKYRQNDLWIAATAVRHDLPLMTLNRGDYEVFARHGGLILQPPLN